jgi:hypothetical protein
MLATTRSLLEDHFSERSSKSKASRFVDGIYDWGKKAILLLIEEGKSEN